jgi:hypothetical protein
MTHRPSGNWVSPIDTFQGRSNFSEFFAASTGVQRHAIKTPNANERFMISPSYRW